MLPEEQLSVVETPTSPSSGLTLSRFEFETDKGNEGTKILMVEWDTSVGGVVAGQIRHGGTGLGEGEGERNSSTSSSTSSTSSSTDWEVSWEGKATVLPIRDADPDTSSTSGGNNTNTRRVYFLLPPGTPIPALVSIAHKGGGGGSGGGKKDAGRQQQQQQQPNGTVLRTKPMPAIFPAELLAGGELEAGRRGVLHTIWAKKRLAELQAEIAAEMKANGESVGLEMAMQERQWIVDHFGLIAPGEDDDYDGVPRPTRLRILQKAPASPTSSPRSPLGGRLGEKLRGLKLATSPLELAAAAAATQVAKTVQPRTQKTTATFAAGLSSDSSDVAISSFSSFGGRLLPKDSSDIGGNVASLDAIVGSGLPLMGRGDKGDDATTEDELFALPMSPRSPEMKRSPFSLL
ncbi:hypothetical protein B0T17DRAFT_592332 [Bombardia bombarda]|uniref:Uncharacterized protein n=1 Tax=Bombardia bombarda TaxID=252184 RepID=A0AA39WND4_9PEZI|nr:hypothetical protein B0T17DRAFT_592332 [Bombardia bombarda]